MRRLQSARIHVKPVRHRDPIALDSAEAGLMVVLVARAHPPAKIAGRVGQPSWVG